MSSPQPAPVLDEQVHRKGKLSGEPRLSHAAFLTAAQLCRGVARMLFVVVAARALGPSNFGIYAFLLATIEMLAVASGSGYSDYLTREAATDEELGWGLAAQLVFLRVALTVLLLGIGLGAIWLLHYPRFVIAAAACFSATLLPRAVSEAVQGVLRGTGHYREFLLLELAFDMGLVTGTVLLFMGRGSLAVVIGAELLATTLAGALAAGFIMKFRTRRQFHLPLRELLRTSAIFNIYTFVGNLYDRLDVVLLSRLGGNYATGIYSAAYRPLGTVQLLPYGILYSLLPALSRGVDNEAQRARFEKAFGLLLCASFVIVMVTVVFADQVVPLIFGHSFAESAVALKILIWAVVLRYANYALNTMLLAVRQERIFVTTSTVCLGINVIANLVFIPIFSWRAAAVVTSITEFALLAQNVFWCSKVLGAVPKPFGWRRTSAVFLVLMVAVSLASKLQFSLIVGSICILVFVMYLLGSGIAAEFRRAWQSPELICQQ